MNKIIKASAGTGKTYRLSLEYLNAVFSGTDFRNIVVMTFTRKATAEIRERIIEHLNSLKKEGRDSEVYEELQKLSSLNGDEIMAKADAVHAEILSRKEKINVYTIDSFVNKIFKRSIAPYLGIKSYDITDKDAESAEKVFKKILENQKVFEMMEDFLSESSSRDIDDYTKLISDIIDQRWKIELIDYQQRQAEENTDYLEKFENCIEIIKEISEIKKWEFGTQYFKKSFRNIIERYFELSDKSEKEDLLYNSYKDFLKDSFANGNKMRGKKVKMLKAEYTEEVELFKRRLANTAFNREVISYEKEVFSFIEKIFEIYDQIKLKEKIFTYSDISNYTYHYLNDENLNLIQKDETTDYFDELIGIDTEYLLIDEFQDTSVLQWKLLKPLINNTDNKIIVGDEKQSIYGWRGGEKELFTGLEDIITAELESLETCYRSDEQILDFVNSFFRNLHPDWDYNDVKVLPEKKGLGYLQLVLGGKKSIYNYEKDIEDTESPQKKQQLENILRNIKADLKLEIVEDIAAKRNQLSEIAVIARKGKDLDEIAEELDKRSIKYIRGSSSSLIEHEAVKPIYSLLRYLYAGDYLSLLKFLRSELIAINHQTLKYLLRNKSRVEKALSASNSREELTDQKTAELIAEIRKMKNMNYADLVHHIFNQIGLFKIYRDQVSALKNIYFFYETLNQFRSLSSAFEYIEENKDSEELQQLGAEDKQAVKLSTIHKAKGLSFDTVFYYFSPKMTKGRNNNSIEIHLEFDQNYEQVEDYLLTNSKYNKILKSLSYSFVEEKEEKELMEEINNDYVALTRAVSNLFIYVNNPIKLYLGNNVHWAGKSYSFYEGPLLRASKSSNLFELIKKKEFGELVTDSSINSQKNIDLGDIDKYFAVELKDKEEFKGTLKYETNKNRLLGTMVHDYLEHIKYDTDSEHRLAENMLREKYVNIVGKELVESVIKAVKIFISQNREIFSSSYEVFNEYTIYAEDEMNIIDRLMVDHENREVKIVDYKTGEGYKQEQLDNYAEIIKQNLDAEYEIDTEFLIVELNKLKNN